MSRRLQTVGLLVALLAGIILPEAGAEDETPALSGERLRLFDLALDHWIDQTTRLQRISQRLRLAGAEACGSRVSPILGITVLSPSQLEPVLREIAGHRFGDKEGLYVVSVFEGLAAARGGVAPGDLIVTVNGSQAREKRDVYRPQSSSKKSVRLEIERGDARLTLSLETQRGCEYDASLVESTALNAIADGSGSEITTALVRATPNDTHLAIIVGHELGHNLTRDIRAWTRQAFAEARADYVGIYLSAMAGYPMPRNAEYWSNVVVYLEQLGTAESSHPSTPARRLAFRKTLTEIEEKRLRNEPLSLR